VKLGQPLGNDFWPHRRRGLQPLGKLLAPGEAQEMRPVDVDDIQGDRDAAGASRLSHELVGDEVGRHFLKDPRYLKRQRGVASEASRSRERERIHVPGHSTAGAPRRPVSLVKRLLEYLPSREMPIQRGASYSGCSRQLGHRHVAISQQRRRSQDPLTAQQGVAAQRRCRCARADLSCLVFGGPRHLRRKLSSALHRLPGAARGRPRPRRRNRPGPPAYEDDADCLTSWAVC
jgi:hypothetical protein